MEQRCLMAPPPLLPRHANAQFQTNSARGVGAIGDGRFGESVGKLSQELSVHGIGAR